MAEAKAKEKTVKIKIPRSWGDTFVSVNEKTWLIKANTEVEVPECVAEVIRNKERMEEESDEFYESVKKG